MFKVLLLVFKVLKGLIPEDFDLRYKGFNGRAEDYLLLETPNFKTVYGKRLFVSTTLECVASTCEGRGGH